MEDKSQSNQNVTTKMNRSKAPQKVEVVVANSTSGSDVNILGELAIFILRIGFCVLMIHHGLEKLDDPQGCLLYTSPSPRDGLLSRMPSSA